MCSLSKQQSILSRETNQNAFLSELGPVLDFNCLSTIEHPTMEHWHLHAVLLFHFSRCFLPFLKKNFNLFCDVQNALNLDKS